jgi:hypothetical protein
LIVAVQRSTRFTAEQIGDMDDDQLLFWATGGKSCRVQEKTEQAGIAWNKSLTVAENLARFKAANEKWKAERGKDR